MSPVMKQLKAQERRLSEAKAMLGRKRIAVKYDEGSNWSFVGITEGKRTWLAPF